MANTDSSRSRQDRKQTKLRTKGIEQSSCNSGQSTEREDDQVKNQRRQIYKSRYQLYPPGPNDTEGWAYLLSILPQAEPTFCRTLNGATPGVDLRLRAIGNGVVPAVAARAFIVLVQKLEKESGLSI